MNREAKLSGNLAQIKQADKMKSIELDLISRADLSIVLSEHEFDLLRHHHGEKLGLLPFTRHIRGAGPGFHERKGVLFIGSFQHKPNIDSVIYFVEEVMPLLRVKIPCIKLYVVGSNPTEKIKNLASQDIEVKGFIEDLDAVLDAALVSVAPLRFGAGIKGKISTALSHGLPVVGTSIASEGMGLTNRENILIADTPHDIANAICTLHEDPNLWALLSQNGVIFSEKKWGAESSYGKLRDVLLNQDLYIPERIKLKNQICSLWGKNNEI